MPLPLLAPAAPALLAAAAWTLAACATGLAAVGVMESTKDKEGEQDKAKADTQTIASSRTECEKCPAIGNVTMVWEKTTSYSEITIAYQTKIAGTIYNPELNLIETWLCMDTNFDGWKPAKCLFLEAKALYDQFFEDGLPKWFYAEFKKKPTDKTGLESMMWQAERQNNVCASLKNIPKSHWHFLQPVSYGYFTKAFAKFINIKTFNTP
ncbi:restriction endonuclease fold toxin 5 domain-containing protein [Photorhabdus bodei]|uniref:restriction endonuclease fold toxin 5 domain-containing protein n=1 Tax=Photorhabdus bodei TaxID=2029681 RepID=UPI00232EF211|nr:restriction endonuclease fold toxin 5 domain-containing protein [Photorhabdus bodei]MDB6369994.1 restriction endonuclease fold toxin 5 domain-containing protein [Photorhabdus bodei]